MSSRLAAQGLDAEAVLAAWSLTVQGSEAPALEQIRLALGRLGRYDRGNIGVENASFPRVVNGPMWPESLAATRAAEPITLEHPMRYGWFSENPVALSENWLLPSPAASDALRYAVGTPRIWRNVWWRESSTKKRWSVGKIKELLEQAGYQVGNAHSLEAFLTRHKDLVGVVVDKLPTGIVECFGKVEISLSVERDAEIGSAYLFVGIQPKGDWESALKTFDKWFAGVSKLVQGRIIVDMMFE